MQSQGVATPWLQRGDVREMGAEWSVDQLSPPSPFISLSPFLTSTSTRAQGFRASDEILPRKQDSGG